MSGDDNAAIASERLRIAAILESPEGKRNPAMAQKLALYSALDADAARGILAEAPAANPYLQAMDAQGPIGLSAATLDVSNDPKAARLKEIETNMAAFNSERRRAQGLPAKD
ncbi:hypothetical protein OZ411_28720 [Bradyrhizobium sp. Arg237L]|uniref:hypothetical protein n=1 Tax=Bradyrhizobium sp. Arg237L TaxID=3003352 RepID=UPI00249F9263|nr:hypothetical protein [Bradyrhizobium sp. Arg237L]MDI4236801.1 hypothetical protein [Bradyrhizobium sp. Arg237L]